MQQLFALSLSGVGPAKLAVREMTVGNSVLSPVGSGGHLLRHSTHRRGDTHADGPRGKLKLAPR